MNKSNTVGLLEEHPTPIADAFHNEQGHAFFLELSEAEDKKLLSFKRAYLKAATWVGHTNTDMDSIASAIGAAHLFEGTAARASEKLNGEVTFVLNHFQVEAPPLFKSLTTDWKKKVCLVDHNQTTQMAEGVEEKHVKGIFDHHALQKNTLCSETPILVSVKPWGSTCTIIAKQYWKEKKTIPTKVASLLLSGILSDTLNLCSPTTTDTDRLMVSMLMKCTGMTAEAVNGFALEMFKAKAAAINELSPYAMIMGDHKIFSLKDQDKDLVKLGFGVIETTSPNVVLQRTSDLLHELSAVRKELNLDFSFVAVVDTLKLKSTLLVCGPGEEQLAKLAFKDSQSIGQGLIDLGKRVSRKLDFIPALDACLQQNHVELGLIAQKQTEEQKSRDFGQVVVECSDHGPCMPTRKIPKLKSVAQTFTFLRRLHHNKENHENQWSLWVLSIGVAVIGLLSLSRIHFRSE
eukprot:TRINITY_DN2976_c0_g1_i1.p1 TRINITY_DN2976_c0_g1~~TRINITY_DN2976_c0_g1_i1.p1  ORF type:complete len:461 (+),score=99.65 TRINITY_DN2976_c0_g1_i1:52-1434(+)